MKTHRVTVQRVALAATLLTVATALGTRSAGEPSHRDEIALKVANYLDSIVQPRFQQDAGRFGISRVATIPGHSRVDFPTIRGDSRFDVLETKNSREAATLRNAEQLSRDYVLCFLRMAHVPGKFKNADGKTLATRNNFKTEVKPSLIVLAARQPRDNNERPYLYVQMQALEKTILPHLPRLRQGASVETASGKWQLFLRPVRAQQRSCIGCHTGAKQGDTLGVMVYAVDKSVSRPPRPATR